MPAAGPPAAGSPGWRARSSPPASPRGRGRSRAAGRATGPSWPRSPIGQSDVAPSKKDRRFKDDAWRGNPAFRRLAQVYLAAGKSVDDLISDAGLDERSERRVRFSAENILDALAPTNFPALNPAALKATLDTGGRNLVQGSANLVHDLSRPPHIPAMVDTNGVHGRQGPRDHARRGGAADRAVRAHPVRAEHAEGARDAAAARPADDQQVLYRRRRAGPEHARVLRRLRPAVLHDLVAQPGRAPRRVGAGRLRLRRAGGARGGRDDHRLPEVARDGAVRGRHHRELRGRPPGGDRAARPDRRADARRLRARQRERRDGRRARRPPDGGRVGRGVAAQGLPRRPRAGGRVRVAAPQRPGVELLGQQLPARQGPAGLRRPLLERATRRTCRPGCTATSWSCRSPTTSCGRASASCSTRRSTSRRSRSTRTRWRGSPTTSRRGRATTARRSCSAPSRASCSPPAGTSRRSSTRPATRRPATR